MQAFTTITKDAQSVVLAGATSQLTGSKTLCTMYGGGGGPKKIDIISQVNNFDTHREVLLCFRTGCAGCFSTPSCDTADPVDTCRVMFTMIDFIGQDLVI